MTNHEPVPLSESLDDVVRALRGPSKAVVAGVFGQWEDSVGEYVARNARPLRFDDGVLTVEVDEPAWVTQVQFMSGEIIRRLAEVAGVDVRELVVRVARRR